MRGVKLWCDDGAVRYRAPRGVVTSAEVARLAELREEIRSILCREVSEGALSRGGQVVSHAPLSFTQMGHWNAYRRGTVPGVRHIATALRLRGHLNVDLLRESLGLVVRRHEALRTNIVIRSGVPFQEVRSVGSAPLITICFDGTAGDRSSGVLQAIEEFVMRPIELSTESLCEMLVIKIQADENILVVAIDHMISDDASLSIVLDELFQIYGNLCRGVRTAMLPVQFQFPDYAAGQRATEEELVAARMPFWQGRWLSYGRLKINPWRDYTHSEAVGWSRVPINIDSELRSALRASAQRRGTTEALMALTAFVAAIMRWCGVTDVLIRYVIDGRSDAGISKTVGFFASVLYLRVQVERDEHLMDLLRLATQEYCRAHANKDCGYLAAQVPRPDFTRNPAFNWIPYRAKDLPSEQAATTPSLDASRVLFTHPMLRTLDQDEEPFVLLEDVGDVVRGALYHAERDISAETMFAFGREFMACLADVVHSPEKSVRSSSRVMVAEPSGREA
ncbi:MAG: condensation domain-containing protein [Pseudomonadota bacterium]|nr:condensation domain-containing protein [Pseudomonadota bacterium]